MTTAQEIELKALLAMPRIAALTRHVEAMTRDLVTYGTHVAIGREVCAQRARKLRKRGESVRYVGRTKTGKARYSWLRRIAPWAIYMPNVEFRRGEALACNAWLGVAAPPAPTFTQGEPHANRT